MHQVLNFLAVTMFIVILALFVSCADRVDFPNLACNANYSNLDIDQSSQFIKGSELHFYPHNLTNQEAVKIGKQIISKKNFSIFSTLGVTKDNYIKAYDFYVPYLSYYIHFRAIECFYSDYKDITIFAAAGPILNKDVYSNFLPNTHFTHSEDIYEYDAELSGWSLVARRYEFDTSLPGDRDFRTCWVVISAESVIHFEGIFRI